MVQFAPFGAIVKIEVARFADRFHCWTGEVPASMTMGLACVRTEENVY